MLKKLWRLILRLFNFKGKGAKVPQGLEVWNEDGTRLVIDENTRPTIVVDVIPINKSSGTYTLKSDLFLNNDVWIIAPQTNLIQNIRPTARYSVSGDTITITTKNQSVTTPNKVIYIGVY